jgi:ubiquitin carboxyl-terminal hydrolase L3
LVVSCRQVRSLGNACGTIGVIHSLANLAKSGFPILGTKPPAAETVGSRSRLLTLEGVCCVVCLVCVGSGALQNFIDKTKEKTPEERGDLLAYDEEIRKIHDGFAQQGQTDAPGEDDHVAFHFISFLNINNHVWSLDGMRAQPTDRGTTSQETFLKVCATLPLLAM